MKQILETQLDMLIALAALDNEIADLRDKLEEIPRAIEDRRAVFAEAQKTLEDTRGELSSGQKEHRKAEGELDAHLEKIRKLNDQQGMVKTNKEYQALLHEIEKLKEQQDGYEEKILAFMEQSGEIEKKITAAEGEVAEAKKAFEEEESRLLAEAESFRAKLKGIEADREAMVPSIEAEHLQLYTRIKSLRKDAVAEVVDELCLGCRVSVPPQKYSDVIVNKDIQTCSHCQRILYFRRKESPEQVQG